MQRHVLVGVADVVLGVMTVRNRRGHVFAAGRVVVSRRPAGESCEGQSAWALVADPRPTPRAASERASVKARHVPNRMIYPLLCVHEALLDCLESSDGRARAFLRTENTMKLVSVHRPDRLLISNESHGGCAEKGPASRYSPRDRSKFPAGPCGRNADLRPVRASLRMFTDSTRLPKSRSDASRVVRSDSSLATSSLPVVAQWSSLP